MVVTTLVHSLKITKKTDGLKYNIEKLQNLKTPKDFYRLRKSKQ